MQFSFENMDFRSICKDLFRNLWVIILAGLTAFFCASGITRLCYTPQYTSSTTLAVNMKENSGNAFVALQRTEEMASVFGEVFESDTLRRKIADSMQVDSIDAEISAEKIKETNLMILSVTSGSPKDSYLILQAALENYKGLSAYLFSNARLDTLKAPAMPFGPSNRKGNSKMLLLSVLLAMFTAALLIAVFSVLRPTVKNESNAKKQLDGRILGMVPFVHKYRVRGKGRLLRKHKEKDKRAVLISSPLFGRPFAEANRRISTVIARHMKMHHEQTLVVSSAGENEGKSSVAANIALSLADKGYRVLLLDGDWLKPSLHKIFEQEEKDNLSVSASLDSHRNLYDFLVEKEPGLYIGFQFHPVRNPVRFLTSDDTRVFLEECKKEFDFILIDTPPMGLSANAELLMRYSDVAALVVRHDFAEIGLINDLAEVFRRTGKDFLGFILNRFIAADSAVSDHEIHGHTESYRKGEPTHGRSVD